MAGASKPYRVLLAATIALVLALPATLGAAAKRAQQESPQPIYAAVSLVKEGTLRRQRCGEYQVFTAMYRGPSNSPDPRLGGIATYRGRVSLMRGGSTGIASGTFTFTNKGRVRARATVNGVITQRSVVNGMVNGKLVDPDAQIRANATLIYNEEFSFVVVRLGLESGANSGVAYPPVPQCG